MTQGDTPGGGPFAFRLSVEITLVAGEADVLAVEDLNALKGLLVAPAVRPLEDNPSHAVVRVELVDEVARLGSVVVGDLVNEVLGGGCSVVAHVFIKH